MPCPTCDHTMHNITKAVHWCPRCGTLIHTHSNSQKLNYIPKLVPRVIEFGETLQDKETIANFERLGLRESVKF